MSGVRTSCAKEASAASTMRGARTDFRCAGFLRWATFFRGAAFLADARVRGAFIVVLEPRFFGRPFVPALTLRFTRDFAAMIP